MYASYDKTRSKRPIKKIVIFSISVLLTCFSLIALMKIIAADPNIPLLSDDGRATWIKADIPVNLGIWKDEYPEAYFRRSFSVSGTTTAQATLTLRAMKLADVYLDGRLIAPSGNRLEGWKKERVIDLTPVLTAGEHELRITVDNKYGPPLLIARSDALNLYTGADWEASLDDSDWKHAVSAARKQIPSLSRMFPDAGRAFLSNMPFLLPIFTIVFLMTLAARSGSSAAIRIEEVFLQPSRIRWVLIGLWVALAINNISKLPLNLGYDAVNHYEYIAYIVKNHRIPLASEGWQMFQSPLNYLISACLYSVSSVFTKDENTLNMLMRVIPLSCGVLQVEVVYRALKSYFPDRRDLQILGIVVGGLLPMNIYIAQYVGNEPLAGLLSAAALTMSLRLLRGDFSPIPARYLSALGLLLGLALLAKVTPILLCPLLALLLIHLMRQQGTSKRRILMNVLLVFGIAFGVSGWYYLRNWMAFGKPFVGGWDVASHHIEWWQDPGYRTITDFLRFGTSLHYPIYAGISGFWDSIYSTFWLDGYLSSIITYEGHPPWNYRLMTSGALLSLLPSAGILLGSIKILFFEKKATRGNLIVVACIGMYLAALLGLYLTLPIYATGKATYMIGIIPCYAIACVTGLDLIMRNNVMAAFVGAMIVCWGIAAYSAYFVL